MRRRSIALVFAAGLLVPATRAGDDFEPQPVPKTFILTALELQAAAPAGSSAFVRLDIAANGTQSLVVRALGLPTGDYDVVVSGGHVPGETPLGILGVGADGTGMLALPPDGGYFSWFVFASVVTVRAGSTVLFSDNLDPPGGGVLLDDPVSAVNGARLVAVGDDLDARGLLVFRNTFGKEAVDVRLERLTPGPYVVEIGGQPSLLMDANAKGRARLRESVPVKPGFGEITVHPIGQEVRVLDASGAVVLAARMPYDPFEEWSRPPSRQKFRDVGDGAADGLRVDFVEYGYVGYGGLDRGWLAWERDASGAASITVQLLAQDFIKAEPYGVFLGDEQIGTVGEYISDDDDPLANTFPVGPEVDLRGQRLEVRDGDEIGLVLTFPQSVPAGVRSYHPEIRKPSHLRLDLLNPGIDLDATGLFDWRRANSGAEHLRIVVRDLPAGDYDIVIDGSVVASGALVVEEAGGEAEQMFSSTGLPEGALPLDFAVHGALGIRAAGTSTTYLQQDLGD